MLATKHVHRSYISFLKKAANSVKGSFIVLSNLLRQVVHAKFVNKLGFRSEAFAPLCIENK